MGTTLTQAAWLARVGGGQNQFGRDFSAVMAAEGIELSPWRGAGGGVPAVLLCERVTEEVFAEMAELALKGCARTVVLVTDRSGLSDDSAWRLLDVGAADVLAWDRAKEGARALASRIVRIAAVERIVRAPFIRENLVGESPAWLAFLRHVVEVSAFSDASVLLLGESGTGKELAARLVHTLDTRAQKRELIVLDCTTVVPELSGSEFFGHERGAYTGAVSARDGAIALAHQGTLFLDEIGELPTSLQAQLLRAVQERTYKRVGGNAWQRSEFRLVCATNRDLAHEVSKGAFRRDLFYRIASCVCRPPTLKERAADILLLTRHFLIEAGVAGPVEFDLAVSEHLMARDYPGNVRDLRQLALEIARRHAGGGLITIGDLPPSERPVGTQTRRHRDETFEAAARRAVGLGLGLQEIGRLAKEAAIREALSLEEGNLQRAARRLGVTDRALQLRKAGSTAPPGRDGDAGE